MLSCIVLGYTIPKSRTRPKSSDVLHPSQNVPTQSPCKKGVCKQAGPPLPMGSQCQVPPRQIENKPIIAGKRTIPASEFI